MNKFELIVTTLFGIEALVAKEIRNLGYETTDVSDGRVTFLGDFAAVARANMFLRTGERVLIKIGDFKACSFDELFDKCKALDWAYWLPKYAKFPIKGFTLKSQIYSTSACQSIIKKSIATSLSESYGLLTLPESGTTYQLEFSVIKDKVTLMLDTSGDGLHKRGYRKMSNAAPLRETIAAAIVTLSRFGYDKIFADPFCGSGTIPIEAALIAKNIAPGINRNFAFENYEQIDKNLLLKAKEEAKEKIRPDTKIRILASDIDDSCIELTKNNAVLAGVSDLIKTERRSAESFTCDETGGTIVTNPPYGERMMELKESEALIKRVGKMYKKLNNWSFFAISPNEKFGALFGRKADKKRKLYNGMIKCNLYQYFKV